MGEGLFVQSMTGVHSGVNPISGDFSVGAEGLMIRDGKLAEPVRENHRGLDPPAHAAVTGGGGRRRGVAPWIAAGQTLAVGDMQISGI